MMAMQRRAGNVGDLRDFVRGGFTVPERVVQPNWDQYPGSGVSVGALEDFVRAHFNVPENVIWNQNKGIRGVGCGGGCGCDSCSGGMAGVGVPSWAATWPSPLNQTAVGIPVVYLIGGGLAALVVVPMLFKRGRR